MQVLYSENLTDELLKNTQKMLEMFKKWQTK